MTVEGGQYGTDDYDTGKVIAVDGDQFWVGWDTGVQTLVLAGGPEAVRPEGTSAEYLGFTISGRSICLHPSSPETMRAARDTARILSRRIGAPVEILSSDGITLECIEAY